MQIIIVLKLEKYLDSIYGIMKQFAKPMTKPRAKNVKISIASEIYN